MLHPWRALFLCCLFLVPLHQLQAVESGQQALNFSLPDLSGGQQSLESLEQPVIFLNFWATWCEPCVEELPRLAELQEEYGPQGLLIVAISLDEKTRNVEKFLERHPVGALQVLLDADGQVASQYRLQGVPSSFLLDPSRRIVYQHEGYTGKVLAEYRHHIEQALAAAEARHP